MEYRSALTLKPHDTIEIPGIGTKQIGAIDQIDHDRYRIRLDEKYVESVVIDVVTRSAPEQRTPERHEGPWRKPSDSSDFRDALREMVDFDSPTNTVIQTELGVGTVAMLTEALDAAGAKIATLAEGAGVPEKFAEADTLLVHDAGSLDAGLAERVSEIVRERTLRGHELPNLKRVILVYPGYGEALPETAVVTEGSQYPVVTLVR